MIRDDLDDQGEWIAILTSEHRTLFGPGRLPRAASVERVLELAEQLAKAHEAMAELYRQHNTVITERLRNLEDTT